MDIRQAASIEGEGAEEAAGRFLFTELPDLAAEKVGGKALAAADEFFAPKENLLKPGRGIFIPDKFTSRGKWMDGWETRRRRVPGHDWCVIRLGLPGVVRGVDVDTNHFLGNFPESCSLEATALERAPGRSASGLDREPKPSAWLGAGVPWREIVPKSRLQGGTRNLFAVADPGRWTHVRLNIYPDGGVARLRVHGEVRPDWERLRRAGKPVDLAALADGGLVVVCNDMFFGPKDNLIMPGRAKTMGEGWETRRKRGPGHDWIVVRLGARGRVAKLEVDTSHFKGNYPDACSVEACDLEGREVPGAPGASIAPGEARGENDPRAVFGGPGLGWTELLPRTKLKAHTVHVFERQLAAKDRPFTHLRLNIYPDGGVARFRAYGIPENDSAEY